MPGTYQLISHHTSSMEKKCLVCFPFPTPLHKLLRFCKGLRLILCSSPTWHHGTFPQQQWPADSTLGWTCFGHVCEQAVVFKSHTQSQEQFESRSLARSISEPDGANSKRKNQVHHLPAFMSLPRMGSAVVIRHSVAVQVS